MPKAPHLPVPEVPVPEVPVVDVIVIGAGVIGITAALALQARGLSVTVIDREGVAAGASRGNAGAFAFAEIEPLATPGIMRKAPRWLVDPLGPLSVRPSYALAIAPWLLRFWRASWRDRYQAAMAAQAGLMTLSRAALDRLARDTDAGALLRHEGQLALYDSAASFRASLPGWEARRAAGLRFDLLTDPGAIAAIQPGLSPRFSHAGFTPDWINTVDPALWVAHLAGVLVARGGRIERAAIAAIEPGADRVRLVAEAGAGGPELAARQVVLAAGAWSRPLLRGIGPDLPLETERGYNTTLPAGAFDLRTHVTFADHGFVVSRIGAGVRVGGAVELGGLRLPPNHARARVLLDKAAAFLPGLDRRGGTQWMGFRPSMPDSLPVIGRAPGAARVILAFGHGHLGLTQSAGTAELVADIACDRPPALDLAPFAPMRFMRGG